MPKIPMLIDCDPGLDDAIAILTAAHTADLVGITTVNGNVGIDLTTHNALAITQIAQLDVPVHRGAVRPLVADVIDASHAHGPSGLGSVSIPELTRTEDSDDAVGFILDMARSVDGLHLVAIGPLTNIALAFRRDPTLPDRLGAITIMGGAAVGGNVTATAEFNIWADPEAAAIVLREARQLTMVGLDITHQVLLGRAEQNTLKEAGFPAAALAAQLLDHAIELTGEVHGWAGAPIHDACAVLAATHPQLFAGETRPVDVELAGSLTRGMTVVDYRRAVRGGGDVGGEPTTMVLRDVDAPAVIRTILDAVLSLRP